VKSIDLPYIKMNIQKQRDFGIVSDRLLQMVIACVCVCVCVCVCEC
jgi:hypothetical protein